MGSARLRSIIQSFHQLNEPVRVAGSTDTSNALLIARLVESSLNSSEKPLIVVCGDEEYASTLSETIELFSSAILGKNFSSSFLPFWEASPYSTIAPSIRTRFDRVSVINRWFSGDRPRVIVSTLPALLMKTIPTQELAKHTLELSVGIDKESRDVVAKKLTAAGYQRVDTTEDPGSFSVRGDLIDVFPPGFDHPIRIEFFGDEIEKIRVFDPEDQKTLARELSLPIRIGPAREVLIHSENIQRIRASLKEHADEVGFSRAVRDPLMERVHEGSYPERSEFWGPFAYAPESSVSFFEMVSPENVVFIDQLEVEREYDIWHEKQKNAEKEALKSGVLVPSFHVSYSDAKVILDSSPRRKSLFIDRLEMANLERVQTDLNEESDEELLKVLAAAPQISKSHRVSIRGNSDLIQEKRVSFTELKSKFSLWLKKDNEIVVFAPTQSQLERIRYLLRENDLGEFLSDQLTPGRVTLMAGWVPAGFRWPMEKIVILSDAELLGSKSSQKRGKHKGTSAAKDWSNLQSLSDLEPGDLVVHLDHGIGKYIGLSRLNLNQIENDFLLIEYANKDKLYLPVYRLNVVQKYMGGPDSAPLDKLGGPGFAKEKEKVKEAVKKIAIDLVKLYAERRIRTGIRVSPRDSYFREFEATFPYDETVDQLKAIDDSLDDMVAGKVMDRLICGDVGYGKTEVAIRAAFKMVSEGHQVAVLVPTTILAHQHELSFKNRIQENYPLRIESVSRFKNAQAQKEILKDVESGKVDIIIGTHRLLSKDVKFKSLGLVIIDEEHRFGVEHKEKLKTFRVNTHVMTMTATPIPRTLHFSLSGLRDISLINTPPIDRLPIRTYISKFDEELIKKAIESELSRGGQVFFVHNRVQSIHEIAGRIQALVPAARVIVGHGQMAENELELVMMKFYKKEADVLIATTIIESGLDVPNANTILINRADAFGLAQLYQLRGRVGRGQNRAYAYLLIPEDGGISNDAKKRLEVIQRFVELGSGFNIASHDLEIRGGGDLLGPQQSGYIASVGFDLYTELLEEAIREIQGRPLAPEESMREPEIKLPFSAFISEKYVPDVHQRLALYRRLSGTTQEAQIDEIEAEIQDRFGKLPDETVNLIWLIRVKRLLKTLRIESLTVGPERLAFTTEKESALDPTRAIALISSQPNRYQLTPDSKFIMTVKILSVKDLYFAVSTLLKELKFDH